ncbi:hypothetical protein GCM10010977_32220 [Citricoccus zhacaiensis]|uniref:SLATT domain-containing protein n=1 Tax=Citricoccus zhacaiensis TaxID=489142 RepID=A0ABQ2MD33_9MICC|nr:hypothetical protein [Citricoccus zhacaiensis]GGO49705.1 hypothetical protein GCM10010977_32220 [Citricoccus zhacaiensis]
MDMQRMLKATATVWITWGTSFVALLITLTPLIPSIGGQIVACVVVAALAAVSIFRDFLVQRDRDALESSATKPFDEWERQFNRLNDSINVHDDNVEKRAQEWRSAEATWTLGSSDMRKVQRKLADTAKKQWKTALRDRENARADLRKMRNNLTRLTGVALETNRKTRLSEEEASPAGGN